MKSRKYIAKVFGHAGTPMFKREYIESGLGIEFPKGTPYYIREADLLNIMVDLVNTQKVDKDNAPFMEAGRVLSNKYAIEDSVFIDVESPYDFSIPTLSVAAIFVGAEEFLFECDKERQAKILKELGSILDNTLNDFYLDEGFMTFLTGATGEVISMSSFVSDMLLSHPAVGKVKRPSNYVHKLSGSKLYYDILEVITTPIMLELATFQNDDPFDEHEKLDELRGCREIILRDR
jgi:hypothetical protein